MDLVFVTNNQNKLSEIKNLISSNYNVLSLKEIDFSEEIEETEKTLKGNALLKAKHIHSRFGYNCFADDTGLEIDYLNGAPGVISARYAGPKSLAKDNINKVLLELKNVENRKARFVTVIALILNGEEYFFRGECLGKITKKVYGQDGFGYDSIFKPNGSNQTFAQISQQKKGEISHRGIAVRNLISFLDNR